VAATPKPFEQAFRSVRRGGRLVFVGLPADNQMALPTFETVLNGITVVRETRVLEQVNDAFDEVLSGRVRARLVFDLR
jgi:alcohol dehydrogenase, propanol-preferring